MSTTIGLVRAADKVLSPIADTFEDLGFDTVVAAASNGESWALAALFRQYQPMLVRYLRGKAPVVADDLASEVWVSVARGMERFAGDEPGFRGWLFTIARNRVIEHLRQKTRRPNDPVDHRELEGVTPDRDDPAHLVVDRMTAQQAVDLVIASLPPDQAEAVLLRVVAGLEPAEIAGIMGRSAGSVRVMCHRALRRLGASLSLEVLAP